MRFWTRWTRNHGAALEPPTEALCRDLNAMPVPAAGERLLDRILESNRRGHHVPLPLEDARPRRHPVDWIGAVAAAVAAMFAVSQMAQDRGATSAGAFEGWFGTASAYAQVSVAAPAYPGARVTLANRMRPTRLNYTRTVRAASAATTLDLALSVARDVVDGTPAWRVVLTSQGPGTGTQQDSTWVSASTFAPLRRTIVEAPYSRYERIVVQQVFSGLRLRGDMKAFRGGALSAHRRVDRTLPSSFIPFISGGFAPVFPSGVAVDRSWKGSVAVLGWAIRDNDVFRALAMKVDGEENVRVPAGEFPCWRIAIDSADGRRQWYWVRKRDGLAVRTLDSTDVRTRGIREIVMVSEQTP